MRDGRCSACQPDISLLRNSEYHTLEHQMGDNLSKVDSRRRFVYLMSIVCSTVSPKWTLYFWLNRNIHPELSLGPLLWKCFRSSAPGLGAESEARALLIGCRAHLWPRPGRLTPVTADSLWRPARCHLELDAGALTVVVRFY